MKSLEVLEAEWNSIYPDGGFWENGRYKEELDHPRFEQLHKEMVQLMTGNDLFQQRIEAYSVCGWSEKHSYFRSKYDTVPFLKEAREILNKLKSDPNWRIPTVIVKETWLLSKTNYRTFNNFRAGDFYNIGFSDFQQVLEKNMCGSRQYSWKALGLNEDRVTY